MKQTKGPVMNQQHQQQQQAEHHPLESPIMTQFLDEP
jgi:hypothetical protein